MLRRGNAAATSGTLSQPAPGQPRSPEGGAIVRVAKGLRAVEQQMLRQPEERTCSQKIAKGIVTRVKDGAMGLQIAGHARCRCYALPAGMCPAATRARGFRSSWMHSSCRRPPCGRVHAAVVSLGTTEQWVLAWGGMLASLTCSLVQAISLSICQHQHTPMAALPLLLVKGTCSLKRPRHQARLSRTTNAWLGSYGTGNS